MTPAFLALEKHPRKTMVSLAEAQSWQPGRFLIQRKYDGQLAEVEVGGARLLVEFMRSPISGHFYTPADRAMFGRHPGGWYVALRLAGDWLRRSNGDAWQELNRLMPSLMAAQPSLIMAETVADVASVMASGSEGVCAHDLYAPWGEMFAHKASGIYVCRVTETSGTQSVGIVDAATGQDRGRVKLGGGKCDQIRLGSLIRVEAMGETDKGKLRQPAACREWLVRY